MTDQEIFNTVVAHLKNQGKKCIDQDETCQYRMAEVINGEQTGRVLKCAAGALLPEANYVPELEGQLFTDLDNQLFGVEPEQVALVRALQITHDDYAPEDWPDRLERVADRFKLRACAVVAWKAELREAAHGL